MNKLVVSIAALLLGAACTAGGAKGKLVDAFKGFSDRPNLSVKISFQSDRESLRALSGDDPEFPQEIFDKLLKSSLTVSGNGQTDPEKARSRVILNLDGIDSFEVRGVGRDLFVKIDLDEIAGVFDLPEDQIGALRALAAQPGLEFLKGALEGRWLKLTGLEKLLEQFSDGNAPGPADFTAAQKKLLAEVAAILDESAEVTESGEDEAGEHLVAAVSLRKFLPALNAFIKEFGGPAGGTPGLQPGDVPPGNLTLDTWVNDGRLTQVEFDFVRNAALVDGEQDIPKGVKKFGVRLNFEDFNGDIEAPSGAIAVDPSKIFQALLGSLQPESPGGTEAVNPAA